MGTENQYVIRILKTHEQLVTGIKKVANKLNKKFAEKEVVLITVMNGGLPFSAELMKHLSFDLRMDFIWATSYHLEEQVSEPKITYIAQAPVKGKDIIIADDLVDSGKTMIQICKVLEAYKPKSITIVALYGKPTRAKISCNQIYCWEEQPGGFLLGFGLDYDEKYRNIPYLAIMREDK